MKGFTLIELMIVVAIVGIIVSVVVPGLADRDQEAEARIYQMED